jgi:TonB family protein
MMAAYNTSTEPSSPVTSRSHSGSGRLELFGGMLSLLLPYFVSTGLGVGMLGLTFGTSPRAQQNSSATQAALPAYPETAAGLEKLVGDIFRAAKKNDTATYSALISSLVRPVPDEWFQDTFGDEGDLMLKEYPGAGTRLAIELDGFFMKMRKEKFTHATAQKHEASCDDNSGEMIYPVMVMRERPVPLYELRFQEGGRFYRLWALAYVDGGFRYVGDLHPPEHFPAKSAKHSSAENKPQDSSEATEKRIRVGGNVAAAMIVHQIQPEYPDIARREHLQGTVKLHAIIAKDGTIRLLRVLTGYCSLAEAAMKAVRQWRYTPTLLEGKPIEVDTTIEVIFTLSY